VRVTAIVTAELQTGRVTVELAVQTIQQAATAAQAQITMLSRPQMTTVHDSAGSRATPAQGQKLSGVVEAAVEASSKER
jgi:hypothetical protein